MIEILLNEAISGRIFPTIIFGCGLLEILMAFASISLKKYIPWPEFVTVPVTFFEALVATLMLTKGPAEIFRVSQKMLTNMRKDIAMNQTQLKSRKREMFSCRPLRVKFGVNFIEPLTPLVIQNFCLSQFANVVLLSRSRL